MYITRYLCLVACVAYVGANRKWLYVRSTAKVIYGREKLRKKEKPAFQVSRFRNKQALPAHIVQLLNRPSSQAKRRGGSSNKLGKKIPGGSAIGAKLSGGTRNIHRNLGNEAIKNGRVQAPNFKKDAPKKLPAQPRKTSTVRNPSTKKDIPSKLSTGHQKKKKGLPSNSLKPNLKKKQVVTSNTALDTLAQADNIKKTSSKSLGGEVSQNFNITSLQEDLQKYLSKSNGTAGIQKDIKNFLTNSSALKVDLLNTPGFQERFKMLLNSSNGKIVFPNITTGLKANINTLLRKSKGIDVGVLNFPGIQERIQRLMNSSNGTIVTTNITNDIQQHIKGLLNGSTGGKQLSGLSKELQQLIVASNGTTNFSNINLQEIFSSSNGSKARPQILNLQTHLKSLLANASHGKALGGASNVLNTPGVKENIYKLLSNSSGNTTLSGVSSSIQKILSNNNKTLSGVSSSIKKILSSSGGFQTDMKKLFTNTTKDIKMSNGKSVLSFVPSFKANIQKLMDKYSGGKTLPKKLAGLTKGFGVAKSLLKESSTKNLQPTLKQNSNKKVIAV